MSQRGHETEYFDPSELREPDIKIRATQTLVSDMSYCWRHPSLVTIEVAWRWVFGVPLLLVLWHQAQLILTQIPPAAAGLDRLDSQNPWISSVLLADAAARYAPAVAEVLRWLAPVAMVAWAVVSGVGRTLVIWRMQRIDRRETESLDPESSSGAELLRKVPGVIALQGLWVLVFAGFFGLWFRGVTWAAETHITSATEPDLIGYLCWLIFLSLGFFTTWALISWTIAVAPILYLHERGLSVAGALSRSFRLGRTYSSKLMEVGLVMSIVKIALVVLAMVFSAAPLPFSDQFGQDFMHLLYVAIAGAYLVGSDYFHVVRLRSSVEFWRFYGSAGRSRAIEFASDSRISGYSDLEKDFMLQVFDVPRWFVSDESSLWDFTEGDTLDPTYQKIRQIYGVDVSDVEGALLWKIFKKIKDRA